VELGTEENVWRMICGVGKRERKAEMSWKKSSLRTGISFFSVNKIENVGARGENRN
jgi:hypothetical protein